jgi:hypothetical protein
VGLYALDRQRQARWLCFDADAPDGLAHLLVVQQALCAFGITTLREASRRGGHLWLICTHPVPATLLRVLALGVLALVVARGHLPDGVIQRLEVYPSVDMLGAGSYSQAVRAPFDVRQRSGVIYPFVEGGGDGGTRPAHELTVSAGLQWFLAQPCASPALLRAAAHTVERQLETALDGIALSLGTTGAGNEQSAASPRADLQVTPDAAPSVPDLPDLLPDLGTGRASLIAWVNATVNVPDLIAEMTPAVQLRPVGQGLGGWCPFHDDRGDQGAQSDGKPGAPSLYVVRNWRYGWSWRCYSTNCGAHRPLLQHTFDWLFMLSGGDIQRALTWARTRYHQG